MPRRPTAGAKSWDFGSRSGCFGSGIRTTTIARGGKYLERARSSDTSTIGARLRARALNGAGGLAVTHGDYEAAKALTEEGLALYRQLRAS
jgi:hypothetical protein